MLSSNVLKDCTNRNNVHSYNTRSKSIGLKSVNNNNRNIMANDKNKKCKAKVTSTRKSKNLNKEVILETVIEKSDEDPKHKIPSTMDINELEKSLDRDISMLSIKDETEDLTYYLPLSDHIGMEAGNPFFCKQMIERRKINRRLVMNDIEKIMFNITDASFDENAGERFLLSTLDYQQEVEMQKFPLGRNFLASSLIDRQARRDVISWVYGYNNSLGGNREVFLRAVSIYDRYVKMKGMSYKRTLHKEIMVCCWYIALKVETTSAYHINEPCDKAGISGKHAIINKLELDVMKVLDAYLTMPNPMVFLRPLSLLNPKGHEIAKYIVDFCVFTYELAGHPAHIIAASAYCLGTAMRTKESFAKTWNSSLQFLTGLSIIDINPVIEEIICALQLQDFSSDITLSNNCKSVSSYLVHYLNKIRKNP